MMSMPLSPEEILAAKKIYRTARFIERQRKGGPFIYWSTFLLSLGASLHEISIGQYYGWFVLCLSLLLLILGIVLKRQLERAAREAAMIIRVLEKEHSDEVNALKEEEAELDRQFLVLGQRV
jgi:hypothetical protein